MSDQQTTHDDLAYRIGKIDLRNGDILVVKINQPVPDHIREMLHDQMSSVVEGHKVLILDRSIDLAVLTRAEIEARTSPTSDHQ